MALIKTFEQLFNDANAPMFSYVKKGGLKIPNLQSDYVIAIAPNYADVLDYTNVSNYEGVLITSLELNMLTNGFTMNKSAFGLTSAKMDFSQHFSFSYIGYPYKQRKDLNETKVTSVDSSYIDTLYITKNSYTEIKEGYPSLVHYYYNQQLSERGTLRIKTKDWQLPAVYIINMRSQTPIYVMLNCMFSLPTFVANPTSNDLVQYKTTVYFNSYKDLQIMEEKYKVNDKGPISFSVTSEDKDYDEYNQFLKEASNALK